MYIQRNKTAGKAGKTYSSTLLCSKYRESGKVKTKVLANLSHLPEKVILGIENMLKSEGETVVKLKDVTVNKCVNYGYPYLIHELLKQQRIDEVLDKTLKEPVSTQVKAMIVGKIITGSSKLGIYKWLKRESFVCELLGIDTSGLKVDELYSSLGELSYNRKKVEKKWFHYHKGSSRRIYLYDLTSTYFEGTQNELSAFGYNRDGKKGKMQICIGLLTDENGFPLRIEVYEGNTADTSTVSEQIRSLKEEFGVEELIFVGDRGMQISYHLEQEADLKELKEIKFITGLTRAEIEELIKKKVIQLSLFGKKLAEVTDGNFRYVLSINPELQDADILYLEHQKMRVDGLLEEIRNSWEKRNLKNLENSERLKNSKEKNKKLKTQFVEKDIDKYKKRVNKVITDCKVTKYYTIKIIDNEKFVINFNQQEFDHTKSLCGKYVLSTNVEKEKLETEEVRGQYKNLQNVEHAFRDLKSDNIAIRPVFHRYEAQTRGHVIVCFFAYAIIKELENKIYPFLQDYNKLNKSQLSFNDIIEELKNIKICELKIGSAEKSLVFPNLNPIQEKIFQLFNINPKNMIT
jgi:transposase